MAKILLLFFIVTTHSIAHEHDDSEKGKLLGVYEDLLQSINLDVVESGTSHQSSKIQMIDIKIGKKTLSIPETIMASLVKEQLSLYEETIREYCECDISKLQKENLKRLPWIMEKVKNTLTLKLARDFGHILSDMLWTEVSGARRYGLIYIVVSTVGEIIDHNISPVPLCKFIAFASRALSGKIKTVANLLWPFDTQIGATTKVKALFSRMHYRRKFRKKLQAQLEIAAMNFGNVEPTDLKMSEKLKRAMRKLEIGYVGLSTFPKEFSGEVQLVNLEEEIKLAMTTLDPMQRMWYTDRLMSFFNFTYLLLLENGKILKNEHSLNKASYFKIQWNVGSYGAEIDKLKILLYAVSVTSNFKKRKKLLSLITEKTNYLLKEFKEYQELFYDIDHHWTPSSKLTFKNSKQRIESKKGKCLALLSKIVNRKTVIWTSIGAVVFSIINENIDFSESR